MKLKSDKELKDQFVIEGKNRFYAVFIIVKITTNNNSITTNNNR